MSKEPRFKVFDGEPPLWWVLTPMLTPGKSSAIPRCEPIPEGLSQLFREHDLLRSWTKEEFIRLYKNVPPEQEPSTDETFPT